MAMEEARGLGVLVLEGAQLKRGWNLKNRSRMGMIKRYAFINTETQGGKGEGGLRGLFPKSTQN